MTAYNISQNTLGWHASAVVHGEYIETGKRYPTEQEAIEKLNTAIVLRGYSRERLSIKRDLHPYQEQIIAVMRDSRKVSDSAVPLHAERPDCCTITQTDNIRWGRK